MLRKCSVGGCESNYKTEAENVNMHGFPTDSVEKKRRIDALPHILPTPVTKNMAVCVNHWPSNYETYRKKGYDIPINPPSIFSVPPSCLRQNCNATPPNVEARNIDAETRRKNDEPNTEKTDPDFIESWSSLEEYRIILIDIPGDPPKLTFSLTIFKDFTISCYKGFTKVAHNDLINGFTYKLEKYSQIVALLERLRGTEINVSEEIKQSALNMKYLLDIDTMDDKKNQRQLLSGTINFTI